MNKADNKFEFGELLTTNEEGYKFAKAIGTTYSLDLKALIAVPVAFRFSGALDAESLKDPFQLFLSLKDTADKIDVFANWVESVPILKVIACIDSSNDPYMKY
ncbi:MAG: hypothetical protein IPF81_03370 [Bacteroidetes bacterium]|nr:hypothetical protein [Bacteroidota bacterium]